VFANGHLVAELSTMPDHGSGDTVTTLASVLATTLMAVDITIASVALPGPTASTCMPSDWLARSSFHIASRVASATLWGDTASATLWGEPAWATPSVDTGSVASAGWAGCVIVSGP
jgi:hypothetical protein